MSQNVDENEEYEVAETTRDKDARQKNSLLLNLDRISVVNERRTEAAALDSSRVVTTNRIVATTADGANYGSSDRKRSSCSSANKQLAEAETARSTSPTAVSLLIKNRFNSGANNETRMLINQSDNESTTNALKLSLVSSNANSAIAAEQNSDNQDFSNVAVTSEAGVKSSNSNNNSIATGTTATTATGTTGYVAKFNAANKQKKKKKNKYNFKPLKPYDDAPCQHNEVFIELDELNLVEGSAANEEPVYEWREVSRWIKFEQHLDSETSIWSKPFVGALVYQSLLYLKTGLQYGTVLLKCDHSSLSGIFEEMIRDFVDSGHMNKENKEQLKKTLLSRHRLARTTNNYGSGGGGGGSVIRKKSTISEFFPYGSRRQSTFTSGEHGSDNFFSAEASRKSSAVQLSDLNLNKSKNKKLSMSDANLLNKQPVSASQSGGEVATVTTCNQSSAANTPQGEASVKFDNQTLQTVPCSSVTNSGSIEQQIVTAASNVVNSASTSFQQSKRRRSTIALIKSTLTQSKLNRSELSIKGVSSDAESCMILVGVVDYLDRPVMSFVRLTNSQNIDDFGDVKCKFVFVLLGPHNENIDYLEIGRCMGTLMTNKDFHDCAYRANDRRELIEGITGFINRSLCLVIPVGEFDNDLMLPIIEWMRAKIKNKMGKQNGEMKLYDKCLTPTSVKNTKSRLLGSMGMGSVSGGVGAGDRLDGSQQSHRFKFSTSSASHQVNFGGGNELSGSGGGGGVCGDGQLTGAQADHQHQERQFVYNHEYDPFPKTGRLFGNLIRELKYRYSFYLSDFRDALNIHCFIAFVFIFTVCIATALSFGGILADKTNEWFGVNEMLIATSMNGIIAGFFSAQPLMILGPTGPFLVFEEMLYLACKKIFCIEFLAVRCWVAMWVLVFSLVMVAFEGVYVIKYVTRFTEEIFAFLIAMVFLTDAVKKIFQIFSEDPIYQPEQYCSASNRSFPNALYSESFRKSDFMTTTTPSSRLGDNECSLYYMERNVTELLSKHQPRPNIALLSFILLIGTCCIALSLKKLRRSVFLGARARRTLSDVGMLISIILMALLDSFIKAKTGVETPKLDIPDSTTSPTKYRTTWFVSPFGLNYQNFQLWIPVLSIIPAALVFVVLFFEIELTGMILNAKHRKLKKGSGFHLDLLITASLMNINSLLGLPWMCAAPVRTLAHWASLTVFSKTYVPGEKPKLIDIKEQRLTNICVHLAIGLCLLAKSLLQMIPISVLFGIFLYFGIVSLSGTQLYERIKLIFIPSKYCPSVVYARGVRPSKRNLFTFIQVFFIMSLLLIKSFNQISYVFSIMLALLVPLRICVLPKIFSKKELEQLDNEDESVEDGDSTLDFYEQAHMPI